MVPIVIIPIYKTSLSYLEQVSLQQVDNVLHNHKIVFIAPHGLNFYYGDKFLTYEVIYFPAYYFMSTNTYSELLMESFFYERFIDYDYMLIYQLDAFVFEDNLLEFCNSGYDYIGAPVKHETWKFMHVGNGGLSLRRVKKFIEVSKNKENIVPQMEAAGIKCWSEDGFFSFCGYKKLFDFNVPSPRKANLFSVQCDYAQGLRGIRKNRIPFGCHGWYKYDYQFWRPIIEQYGYKLPDLQVGQYTDSLRINRKEICYRCIKRINRIDQIIEKHTGKTHLSLWGLGKFGSKAVDIFCNIKNCNLTISRIYDRLKCGNIYRGINVLNPDRETLSTEEGLIVITTPKYELEISDYLLEMGLCKGKDFISFDELIFNVGMTYINNFGKMLNINN